MRRELTEDDLITARIPRGYWGASLAGCSLSCADRLNRYAESLDEALAGGYGLILGGPNGGGKSWAAAALLKEAIRRGYSALWATAHQLSDWQIQKTPFEAGGTLSNRLLQVDFAVIEPPPPVVLLPRRVARQALLPTFEPARNAGVPRNGVPSRCVEVRPPGSSESIVMSSACSGCIHQSRRT